MKRLPAVAIVVLLSIVACTADGGQSAEAKVLLLNVMPVVESLVSDDLEYGDFDPNRAYVVTFDGTLDELIREGLDWGLGDDNDGQLDSDDYSEDPYDVEYTTDDLARTLKDEGMSPGRIRVELLARSDDDPVSAIRLSTIGFSPTVVVLSTGEEEIRFAILPE